MIIEINTLNNIVHALGKGGATKSDEFSEKFGRGGGSFSIQKIYIADFGNFSLVYFYFSC